MSNEQLRKYVNLIDNGPKKRKKSINESAGARIKYKRVQALTEAQRLVQLIENSEFTEEQLNELFGGVSALANAAGRAISGGATAAGQGLQKAGSTLATGAQRTADAAGRAVTQMGQKVGDIYQQGEKAAADERAKREQEKKDRATQAQLSQLMGNLDKNPDLMAALRAALGSDSSASPKMESRRYRKR